jgi:hypothetical protein
MPLGPAYQKLAGLGHAAYDEHPWIPAADLHVGPSSGDLPLHTTIEIPGS